METPAQSTNVSVLAPLDGSYLAEHAIPYGKAVAGPRGRLILLEVVHGPEPIRGLLGDTIVDAQHAGEVFDIEARTRLADAAERWKPVVGEVQIETRQGNPTAQIIAFAEEQHCNYIAMASHGKGALHRLAFGSVTDEVARTSPVPVLIVHPKSEKPTIEAKVIKRMILPMDGSKLAEAALPVAIDLGKRLNLPAVVVRAITPEAIATMYPGTEAFYAADVYDDIITQQEKEAKAEVEAEAAKLVQAGVEAKPRVLIGSAVDAIENIVEPGDIVVMTSHGRTGIKRLVLGSVAEQLIRSAIAPVVLVPAPGRKEAAEE
jgi:nucleotide-binding universal stress UspA family protein